ncbi:nucleotidyltransferase family protein [Desulfosporosinus sp. PR]|uniref:nucleotidyltransferase family protein n=1 Tax=Candidatus Desulfosporosinus nitrosoreducens TaxID=3401928 RepID=UPI0027F8B9FC|nr:nucleotidyltransferase family protein [Desulfosporosinus sp. PR]MDQ7092327.1 nucleotidyltransferase family protein [Desulfosporosinus sp. PR]
MSEPNYEQELKTLILKNDWFMKLLRAVQELKLPDWFIGAGVIRTLVWDHLHGYKKATPVKDVDVVYFNASELSPSHDQIILEELKEKLPEVPWEVTNQAAVHLWFEKYFGYSVQPLESIEEAVSTWPETATSIGVRLLPHEELYICAPFGLEDLFRMTLRRNPKRVTLELFRKRFIEKEILHKWPQVRIIDG